MPLVRFDSRLVSHLVNNEALQTEPYSTIITYASCNAVCKSSSLYTYDMLYFISITSLHNTIWIDLIVY